MFMQSVPQPPHHPQSQSPALLGRPHHTRRDVPLPSVPGTSSSDYAGAWACPCPPTRAARARARPAHCCGERLAGARPSFTLHGAPFRVWDVRSYAQIL